MVTKTSNYELSLPADNDTNWGQEVNANFSLIDTLLAARIPNPSGAAVGDLLMWLSTGWSRLAAPAANYVLCGNGVGAAPSFKAFAASMMTVDANIAMAGKKITGLAAGSDAADAVRYDQLAALPLLKFGMILLWSGSIATIPAGYVLCNGSNSTPDLRDRFVVGAGNTYAVGATGGEAAHALTSSEAPPIYGSKQSDGYGTGSVNPTVYDLGYTGVSGAAHNNLPPYYALAYIMKV